MPTTTTTPGTFAHLYAQLPDGDTDAHRRGQQFEQLVWWLLHTDPVLTCDIDTVWRWEDWTDRFHPTDIGIDFVCQMTDGTLMAVQAKAWASPPTYRDLGTFWAASQVPDTLAGWRFTSRLLICPAGLSERIPPAIYHAVPDTRVWDADALEGLAVDWPTSINDVPTVGDTITDDQHGAVEKLQLREHQRQAVDATVAGLTDHDRVQLQMACGTGKTLVGQRTAEQATGPDDVVVVAVPSLALLAQTRTCWARDTSRPISIQSVCSEQDRRDDAGTAELVGATTDPDAVSRWLTCDHDGRQRISLSTYHSLDRVADALAQADTRAGLLVCDEAHRLAGRPDDRFAVALDDARFPADRRLFMTATPRRFEPSGRGEGTVVSMDDETLFGPRVFEFGFDQAVRAGLLVDYELAALAVDRDDIRTQIDQRRLAEVAGVQLDVERIAQVAGTVRAIERFGLSRVVVFHSRVRDARAHARLLGPIAEALGVDTDGWWTDSIVGTTRPAAREATLGRLRQTGDGQVGVVCTARVLSEGVDVPALDAVVFADPKGSQVDVVQAVGRVMRTAPGKERGYVVVPVVVGDGQFDGLTGVGPFAPVGKALAALADHDPVLRDRLDRMRRARGRRGGAPVGALGAHTDGRARLHFDRLEGERLAEVADAVSVALVEKTTLAFEFKLGLFERYVRQTGNADVEARYCTPDGWPLGRYVNGWRVAHNKGEMPESQRVRLDRVHPEGFVWARYRKEDGPRKRRVSIPFDVGVDHARRSMGASGRWGTVAQGVVGYTPEGDEFDVGVWWYNVRSRGQRGSLTARQISTLDSLGMVWLSRDPEWRPTPVDR